MGLMKDFDIRIRNGGDDAAGAVNELMAELQRRLLELQDSMPRWIPVTERLPTLMTEVLGWHHADRVRAWFRHSGKVQGGPQQGTYWEQWSPQDRECDDCDVDEPTHWMPLPAPPTDGKQPANSAFTSFDGPAFRRMQERNAAAKDKCLFVTCPDIVGSMRRSLEVWRHRDRFSAGFDLCLVLQNGAEDMDIPWHETPAVFIGGIDPWKESAACADLIRTAQVFGLHVHCGRVNQIKRFEYMSEMGVDTCDGSGVSRYGFHQLLQIVRATNGKQQRTLFTADDDARSCSGADAEVEV